MSQNNSLLGNGFNSVMPSFVTSENSISCTRYLFKVKGIIAALKMNLDTLTWTIRCT